VAVGQDRLAVDPSEAGFGRAVIFEVYARRVQGVEQGDAVHDGVFQGTAHVAGAGRGSVGFLRTVGFGDRIPVLLDAHLGKGGDVGNRRSKIRTAGFTLDGDVGKRWFRFGTAVFLLPTAWTIASSSSERSRLVVFPILGENLVQHRDRLGREGRRGDGTAPAQVRNKPG